MRMKNKRVIVITIAALLGMSTAVTTQAASKAATPTKTTTSTPKSGQSSASSSKTTSSSTAKSIPAATLVSSTTVDEELPYHIEKGYVYTSSKLDKQAGPAKDFSKVTWYTEKKAVIDRSAQGSGNSVWYYVKSGSGAQSGWIWQGNLEPISEGTFDIAMKNSDYFKNQNIICLGDSITKGYDGYETLDNMGYPNWLNRYLNTTVLNAGYNGAFLCDGGEQETTGDLTPTVNSHNFKNYDVATIAYGTNDYGHVSNSLSDIQTTLRQNIKKMKSDNKNLIIYGILPTTRYDSDTNSDNIIGKGGFTMNDLRDAEAEVYKEFNIPYLDWRKDTTQLITDSNHEYRLYDERLHPSAKTYQLMGREIAQFMINNYPKDKIKTTKKSTKTTTKKATTPTMVTKKVAKTTTTK
ncbi:SGNH/GDSL hydrolase family protein [Lentilactobacillus hilgardii]|uniref:SGNH/GDSL hydrolase family protein n=1 Tax=Lentilactobacillus hilgardii TaxID=1588 RepID=UPI0029056F2C|nr:SGNH/GDSL hydrolase family protein [Lentilactobacillus hilgardii]MCP9334392.1 SGNH/GDSL hydrolase family protein [Lentilactobacillus hilgardii]MCP9350977.1 SGNH/GDSL hydrolase family protein [Lentilactobacillus hilgardii]MCP9353858.1 SGNH/GDSL hydrolase family protein [Lentilactobacillus hilgardii]